MEGEAFDPAKYVNCVKEYWEFEQPVECKEFVM